jgi:hypothetical protein
MLPTTLKSVERLRRKLLTIRTEKVTVTVMEKETTDQMADQPKIKTPCHFWQLE